MKEICSGAATYIISQYDLTKYEIKHKGVWKLLSVIQTGTITISTKSNECTGANDKHELGSRIKKKVLKSVIAVEILSYFKLKEESSETNKYKSG